MRNRVPSRRNRCWNLNADAGATAFSDPGFRERSRGDDDTVGGNLALYCTWRRRGADVAHVRERWPTADSMVWSLWSFRLALCASQRKARKLLILW